MLDSSLVLVTQGKGLVTETRNILSVLFATGCLADDDSMKSTLLSGAFGFLWIFSRITLHSYEAEGNWFLADIITLGSNFISPLLVLGFCDTNEKHWYICDCKLRS